MDQTLEMDDLLKIDKLMEEYANCIPAKGSHFKYLCTAMEIMQVYGEILSIMEDEETPDNVSKVLRLLKEIEEEIEEIIR